MVVLAKYDTRVKRRLDPSFGMWMKRESWLRSFRMDIELIDFRRERAKETLRDAKVMFEKASLFSTVNRIYYSIFYGVIALLLTEGLSSSKS